MTRKCGTCSACCTVLKVVEIEKPVGRRCPHQCKGGGCGVYTSRPPSCRLYTCDWLVGLGDEKDRPDITKIVLDGHGHIMQMWERQHGALDTEYARTTRQKYLDQGYIVSFLSFRGKKTLYLSPGRSEEEVASIRKSCAKENMTVVVLPERA